MSKSPRKERDALWKWVVIGDSGTGKTSILSRLCNDEFNNTFISTIGIDFKIKKMEFNGQNITIQIWDTVLIFVCRAIGSICSRTGAIRTSFEDVNKWLKDIEIMNNSEKHVGDTVSRILLGNKFDMEGSNRAVSTEEAQAVAEKHGIPFVEVSAKTGKNIERAFVMLAELILGETTTNYNNNSNSKSNSSKKETSTTSGGGNSNNSKDTTTSSSSNPGNKSMLGLVSRNNNKSNSSWNTSFASSLFSASSTADTSSSSSSPTPNQTPTQASISTPNHGSENQSSFSNEDSDVIRLGNFHPSPPSKTNPTSNSGSNPDEEENLFDKPVRKSRCC